MSVGRSCYLFWLIFLTTLSGTASAQSTTFDYSHLKEEYGLAQDFVYSILQDKKDFIWISTGRGLSRYDGRSIDNFTEQQGLSDNFVTSSGLLSSGRLLFGHQTGRITSYNGVYFESLDIDTLKSEIISITEDLNGNIWCVSKSSGLLQLKSDLTPSSFSFPGELQGKIVNDIVILSGQLIVATNEGLYTFQISGHELFFIDSPDILRFKEITALETVKHDSSSYWIGSGEGEIYRAKAGTTTKVVASILIEDLSSSIKAIVEVSDKALCIGTQQNGAYLMKLDEQFRIKESSVLNDATGFPIREIKTIFNDSQRNLWIGTEGNGVIEIYPKYIQFFDLKEFNIKKVNAIDEGIHGYYVATDDGMLTLSVDSLGRQKIIRFGKLPHEPILSIYRGIDDLLWIGTENDGIYVYAETTDQLKRVIINYPDGRPLRARLFKQDTQGNTWISSIGNGVYKMNRKGVIVSHLSTETGFIHNDIFAILPDTKGRVWFGSQGAGLARLDLDNSMQLLSQQRVFPSHDVNDITEDGEGNIWIATDGQGYFKFNEQSFENGGVAQSKVTAFLTGMTYSKQNRIWMSYRKGISYIDLKTGKQRDFTTKEGLQTNESYGSKITVDSGDNILICHEQGITILHASKMNVEFILRTYLTGIRISFEQRVEVVPTKEQIQASVYPPAVLPYNQNHLTFDFTATSINYSGPIYYRYYIKEFESVWSPPTISQSATYSSLNPGNYTFLVQATNNLEKWTDPVLNYSFIIQKPYWQEWWFYLLQITGICALFGTTYLLSRTEKTKTSILRVMVFTCLFIIFEFIQNLVDPITSNQFVQAPIFKTLINLCLGLLLLPMEKIFRNFFAKHAKNKDLD